jgi:hypothetical protein
MTKREYEERSAFEQIIKDEVEPNQTGMETHNRRVEAGRLAGLLMRHAKTHHRLQEMVCNGCGALYGESNESFSKRQMAHETWVEKRDKQIEHRITEICRELGEGFSPVFSGDPRGCTVKIKVPSGRTNDWSKEGVCVPC